MAKKSIVPRVLVQIPVTAWMRHEFGAEIERSVWREAEARADKDEAIHGIAAVGSAIFRDIIVDMMDIKELAKAAVPDFVEAVGEVLARRHGRSFRFVLVDIGAREPIVSMPESVAEALLQKSNIDDHHELVETFELDDVCDLHALGVTGWHPALMWMLIEGGIDAEDFQLEVLDELASETDALICDRLIDEVEFAARVEAVRSRTTVSSKKSSSASDSIH